MSLPDLVRVCVDSKASDIARHVMQIRAGVGWYEDGSSELEPYVQAATRLARGRCSGSVALRLWALASPRQRAQILAVVLRDVVELAVDPRGHRLVVAVAKSPEGVAVLAPLLHVDAASRCVRTPSGQRSLRACLRSHDQHPAVLALCETCLTRAAGCRWWCKLARGG